MEGDLDQRHPLLETVHRRCSFWTVLFYAQLIAGVVACIVLFVSGEISRSHSLPLRYVEFTCFIFLSGFLAVLWALFTLLRPQKALDSSFYLSPIITALAAVSFWFKGSPLDGGLAFASGLIPSLTCWCCMNADRRSHTLSMFADSFGVVPPSRAILMRAICIIGAAILYDVVWMIGVGGLAAYNVGGIGGLYGTVLVLIVVYTMQVLEAFGGWLTKVTNQWGLVGMGLRGNDSFTREARDIWFLFGVRNMHPVIRDDITSRYVFMSAVTGGELCAIISGWAFYAVDRHHDLAKDVALCIYLLAYLLFSVSLAWPQACVMAYQVAVAEIDPHNVTDVRIGTCVLERMLQLELQRVQHTEKEVPRRQLPETHIEIQDELSSLPRRSRNSMH